jgi:8-oxo-dGTP pyrophosphatase MutT (NUDIX family)
LEDDGATPLTTPVEPLAALRRKLLEPLPGRAAQAEMEPDLAFGRHFDAPAHDARRAAVTILVYPHDGVWHLPLTLRPDYMPVHAGQVCLPGGLVDGGESTMTAALRELDEELGVPAAAVEMLGPLSPIHVFGTRFYVEPWLVAARARPPFRPSEFEVAELLEVPVEFLADPACRGRHLRETRGVAQNVPHFEFQGHRIWGATAMMLAEFVAIWREAAATTAEAAQAPPVSPTGSRRPPR